MTNTFICIALGMSFAIAFTVRQHTKELMALKTDLIETREFCLKLQQELHPDVKYIEPGIYPSK